MVPHFNNVVSTGAQKFPDYTAGKIRLSGENLKKTSLPPIYTLRLLC